MLYILQNLSKYYKMTQLKFKLKIKIEIKMKFTKKGGMKNLIKIHVCKIKRSLTLIGFDVFKP